MVSEDDDKEEALPILHSHLNSLHKCESLEDLQSFQPLVQFLKHYFEGELSKQVEGRLMPRVRGPYEQVHSTRTKGLVTICRNYYLNPVRFVENLQTNSFDNKPSESYEKIHSNLFAMADDERKAQLVTTFKKFTAVELSVQPFIRSHIKRHIYFNGVLCTEPTEEGVKAIDLYHPAYRAKYINHMRLAELSQSHTDGGHADIFLDVLQLE